MYFIFQYWIVFLFVVIGSMFLITKKSLSLISSYKNLSQTAKNEANEEDVSKILGSFMLFLATMIGVSIWYAKNQNFDLNNSIIQMMPIFVIMGTLGFIFFLFKGRNFNFNKPIQMEDMKEIVNEQVVKKNLTQR